MSKYLLVYRGGSRAATPEAQEQAMADWGRWFGELGAAVVDPGAPVGERATLGGETAEPATGYSLLEADSLTAATGMAEGCPILAIGGSVEVAETIAM